MYRYSADGRSVISDTGVFIPVDPGNRHYVEVLNWIAQGNSIAPYTAPALTQDDYARAIQSHIDATAQSKGYADGVALASYITSTIPTWQAEAAAFVPWRDSVWVYAYTQMAAVQGGQREQPTVQGLIAELPAIVWP